MILGNLPRIEYGKGNRDYSSNVTFEKVWQRDQRKECVVDLGKFVVMTYLYEKLISTIPTRSVAHKRGHGLGLGSQGLSLVQAKV
ncbi:unnamed protein product [Prunus armeniaca]|uniref:Uncharacterized protein n=1 Tax=Prunus armeniaca TaxID=36596 RepID=A0A6J5U2J6_PRUAR|nr:unnamed protein product [Prunus armeniaca]